MWSFQLLKVIGEGGRTEGDAVVDGVGIPGSNWAHVSSFSSESISTRAGVVDVGSSEPEASSLGGGEVGVAGWKVGSASARSPNTLCSGGGIVYEVVCKDTSVSSSVGRGAVLVEVATDTIASTCGIFGSCAANIARSVCAS